MKRLRKSLIKVEEQKLLNSLPVDDIKTNIVYLISDGDTNFIQWIYIDNEWNELGSTEVDLSMIGNLENISTTVKGTIVNAINEGVKTASDGTKACWQ